MHNERLVPLHSLPDVQVAGGYTDIRGFDAFLSDGRPVGRVRELLVDPGAARVEAIALDLAGSVRGAGERVPIEDVEIDTPARRVLISGSGAERLAAAAGSGGATAGAAELMDDDATRLYPAAQSGELDRPELARAAAGQGADQRLTLNQEELAVYKERVAAGEVRVQKHVETRHVRESVPVMREEVTVERRAVTNPDASTEIRYEGDTMFVPIVEEELVVQKRTVVREELVIRRRQVQGEQVVEADLRRERAEVHEVADGGGMPGAPDAAGPPRDGPDGIRVR